MDTPRTAASMHDFLNGVKARNPHRPEFLQAVHEVVESVWELAQEPDYRDAAILERLVEPDRVVRFRVTWEDDDGGVHVERAWRVQHCGAIGPYKGGLRFHPSVDESTLQFLAFEQTFKNALTGLPMGGGKGGSDFTSKGKSEAEIMRFCQAFMDEYMRYTGEATDVPAGDIGVGGREVGFLFGRYLRLTSRHVGMLTGKPEALGGMAGRTEATGYGTVKFAMLMLDAMGEKLAGKRVAISGAGNVAQYAAERVIREGGTVASLSNSEGSAAFGDGLSQGQLEDIRDRRERGDRLKQIIEGFKNATFRDGQRPWDIACDVALPCATQNELDEQDAERLVKEGVKVVAEGANMPCTSEAHDVFERAGVAHGVGKAANAGGVAVSGLEMSQNATRVPWEKERVLAQLAEIVQHIPDQCVEHGGETDAGRVDYTRGANVGGFIKLRDAIVALGVG